MTYWSQLILKLSTADRNKAIKQWTSLPEYDGHHKNTVWLKFKTRAEKNRKMQEIKSQINKLPENNGRKFTASWGKSKT